MSRRPAISLLLSAGNRPYLRISEPRGASLPTNFQISSSAKQRKLCRRFSSISKTAEDGSSYPRVKVLGNEATFEEFSHRHAILEAGATALDGTECSVFGRINRCRTSGSKLLFVDLHQAGKRLQAMCSFNTLAQKKVSLDDFNEFRHVIKKGDILKVHGLAHRTQSGELSISAIRLPEIVSPCLQTLPMGLSNPETKIKNRHTDFLVNPRAAQLLRLRAGIIQHLRHLLEAQGHVEVQTPILGDGAGGALARSFTTSATEFPHRTINLRISPELWLKRLVVGGFDRVFEIGPSFRNEGIDSIHNPEFTTCEFYRAYCDLDFLMSWTESFFEGLATFVESTIATDLTALPPPRGDLTTAFRRLDFISGIENAMNHQLPDLTSADAQDEVFHLLESHSIRILPSSTLPQMLDHLSSIYLEPQCTTPTFIIHHPECLSPLAKSFRNPATRQMVSARAELFVESREIANMYEEENSPFEQRRKFADQLKYRSTENQAFIDEDYLEVLEWGLPPTGGWGCGIERLCMLMSGASRISDVLPFGSLRNVVSLRRSSQVGSEKLR